MFFSATRVDGMGSFSLSMSTVKLMKIDSFAPQSNPNGAPSSPVSPVVGPSSGVSPQPPSSGRMQRSFESPRKVTRVSFTDDQNHTAASNVVQETSTLTLPSKKNA